MFGVWTWPAVANNAIELLAVCFVFWLIFRWISFRD